MDCHFDLNLFLNQMNQQELAVSRNMEGIAIRTRK